MRAALACLVLVAGCAGAPADEAPSAGAAALDTETFAFHPRAELLGQRKGWAAELRGARSDLLASGVEPVNVGALEGPVARQRAGVDPGNAYWLARLSAIAYRDGDELTRQLTAIGLPTDAAHFQFFTNTCTDAQAFYVTNAPPGYAEELAPGQASPYFAVLAFRGTQPKSMMDIGTDLAVWPTPTPIGDVHGGFARQLRSLWSTPAGTCGVLAPLGPYLRARHVHDGRQGKSVRRGAELYFTGHSLGAALAEVALTATITEECERAKRDLDDPSCFDLYTPVTAVITLGAPRVGDEAWATWLGQNLDDRTALYRYVNGRDLVPHFPGYPFRHVLAYGEEDLFRVQLTSGAPVLGVAPPADPGTPAGGTMMADIAEHAYGAYITALAKVASR